MKNIEYRVLRLVPLIGVHQPVSLGFHCHRYGCAPHVNERFSKYHFWNRDLLLWVASGQSARLISFH